MTKSPHELFAAERPVRSDFARQSGVPYAVRRVLTLIVLLAIVIGGGMWGWGRLSPSGPVEIPTIKAEGPYKQKPDQPGGVDIPNQDVQVYHEIDGNAAANTKPVVEHMLPPPEVPNIKPAAPSQSFAQSGHQEEKPVEELKPVHEIQSSNAVEDDPILNPQKQVIATTVEPVETKPTTQTPAVTPVATKEEKLAKSPIVKTEPVESKPATILSEKAQTVIQLAALPDENAAKTMAQKLQSQYKSILGNNRLHTVRADLGAKGIFYRIQSQPLMESQAKSICNTLKAQKAGCILVRP